VRCDLLELEAGKIEIIPMKELSAAMVAATRMPGLDWTILALRVLKPPRLAGRFASSATLDSQVCLRV
jgi:hypothetical protein